MVSPVLNVIVQSKADLSVGAVNDFIASCVNPKLVLVYSSLKSDVSCIGFFEECVKGIKLPFVGVRTAGFFTLNGFHEDSVVFGVLCGDFDVKLVCERIDYGDLDRVAENIIPQIGAFNLSITHSANMHEQCVFLDAVLRRVNAACPNLQVVGGVSSPNPFVVCNEGIYSEHIVIALISGFDFVHRMFSGFIPKVGGSKHVVTRSDEYYVNEIDGTNAAEFISGKFKIRPYFLNLLSGLTTKSSISQLFVDLSKASPVFEKAILHGLAKPLGRIINKDLLEVYLPVKLFEKESRFLTTSHVPEKLV